MKKILSTLIALAFAIVAHATTFTENFTGNPLTNGWQIFGDTNLFQWDSTNHNLAATWDSSQSNSYFYKPLGITLTTNTDFGLDFDLRIKDALNEGGTFQIAVGLVNITNATNPEFLRDTGFNSTNVVEFDFFMDPFFGNSIAATEIDANGLFADVYDNVALDTNTTYHVSITHFAGDTLISAEVLVSNVTYSFMLSGYLEGGFGDFNLNALAIPSYSDEGAYGASLLAHGTVANVVFTTNPNPVRNMSGKMGGQIVGQTNVPAWTTEFQSYSNWTYRVERSIDLKSWTPISDAGKGTGAILDLLDTNMPPDKAFYRVHAHR